MDEEGYTNQTRVQKYNTETNQWTDVADLPIKIGHISPPPVAGKYGIIVVGGTTNKKRGCGPPGKHTSVVQYYNPSEDKWYKIESGVQGASMVTGIIKDVIYSQHGKNLYSMKISWDGAP